MGKARTAKTSWPDESPGLWHIREGRPDPVLFFLLIVLAGFGLLVLMGVSSGTGQAYKYFYQQILSFGVGIGLFLIGLETPLPRLRRGSYVLILVAIVLMLIVFIPGIGQSRASSAHIPRWIGISLPGIGRWTFQPVEFAKVAIVIFLAYRLSDRQEDRLVGYIGPLIPVLILTVLTAMQPNFGSAVLLILLTTVMVFVSGIRLGSIFSLGLIITPLLFVFLILRSYRSDRILVWLNPYQYPAKAFQVLEAFKGFHEGGLLGRQIGWGRAHRVLPDRHNDFVFAMIANDYGLIGVGFTVLLYLFITWRTTAILRMLDSPFYKMLGFGLLMIIILQSMLNMAVVTGLLPTTGISLPFVSLGGSNLIMNMLAMGLLLNVTSREFNHRPTRLDR